jgi:hypothetical protein
LPLFPSPLSPNATSPQVTISVLHGQAVCVPARDGGAGTKNALVRTWEMKSPSLPAEYTPICGSPGLVELLFRLEDMLAT